MTTPPVPAVKRASRTKTAAKTATKASAKKAKAVAPVVEAPVKPALKRAPKAAAKSAAKPVVKAPEAPRAAAPKLVRDSFTIPSNEYETLAGLKRRSLTLGTAAKKSELLRAGILALNTMADAAFLAAVKSVPNLKTGRPKKHAK